MMCFFHDGDEFNLAEGSVYRDFMKSKINVLNNGDVFNYDVKIKSCNDEEAIIEISSI